MGIEIVGTGVGLPDTIVTNERLIHAMNLFGAHTSKGDELTAESIENKLLIHERRRASKEDTNSSLGYTAGLGAMIDAGVDWDKLDVVICPSSTLEAWFTSMACNILKRTGIERGPMAFDLSAACTGFVYSLDVVNSLLIAHRDWEYGLVIATEITSRNLDLSDSNSQVWGDGAGAVLLKKTDRADKGIICTLSESLPQKADLTYSQGRSNRYGETWCMPNFVFDGPQVQEFVLEILKEAIPKTIAAAGLENDDIDLIIPHQANGRIVKIPARFLKIPIEKFFINVANYANMSNASIPVAIHEARQQGLIKPGSRVLLVGFGGGLTWGSALLQF